MRSTCGINLGREFSDKSNLGQNNDVVLVKQSWGILSVGKESRVAGLSF